MGKLTLREIRKSLGRFLAIAAIVALGVGFFCGLRLTKTAMVKTMDTYTDTQSMYDFRLVSTVGFEETDAASFADGMPGVLCEGSKTADALAVVADGAARPHHFMSMPETLNVPSLKAGRLPQRADECLADSMLYGEKDLGSTIVITQENDDDTLEKFARREFTIVGVAKSVLYANYERGSTSVGSGALAGFVYVLPEVFDLDYETELYVRLQARQGEAYSDEYEARIDDAEPQITALAETLAQARADRLTADAEQELSDARATLDEKEQELADAKETLADAKQTLADAEQEVTDGEQKLADAKEDAERELADAYQKLIDGQQELEENEQKLADARQELEDGEQQLADAQQQYEDGVQELDDGRKSAMQQLHAAAKKLSDAQDALDAQRAQVDEAQKELDAQQAQVDAAVAAGMMSPEEAAAAYAQIEAGRAELDKARQQLSAAQDQIDAGREEYLKSLEEVNDELDENQKKLDKAKTTLDEKEQELADGKQELADGEQKLADAKQELADGWAEYYDGKAEAEQKIADAEQELADARQQLTDGKQELSDAEQELSDGEQKLADAEQEYQDGLDALDKLKEPDVYVLDRSSNVGYACFESDSDIVRGVSRVFPLFFFAVAALVCITTMTRMVDEQRTQAGVLKAMGYSNGAIMSVYFLYAGSASILGCVVGISAGAYFLPKLIWQGYNIMYGFTDILFAFDWPLALGSVGAYLICALGTTWYAIEAELSRPAAELIRPKAPKAGKRILLERLPFIWKRIPFLHKVSIRNILRYKKRMIMMAIGIGGCTALLITGFGIQDSIRSVVDYQYEEITRYDASVTFAHAMTQEERETFSETYAEDLAQCGFAAEKSLDASANGQTKTTNVVCPESGSVDGLIDLHTKAGEPVAYPADGACIISRGLADALRVSVGDTVTLRDTEMHTCELPVAAVFENYVYNYVYLTQNTWQTLFAAEPEYETAWLNFPAEADAHEISATLSADEDIAVVNLSTDFRARVATMMESMQYIVLIVVICAAALAFIVLYNLTNINITERAREIATIKVLGFYDAETNRYIFRENIILTILGAIVGLPMGKALHAFVMSQIKIDLMCFDVRVEPKSYLFSVALTLGFGLLVNAALRRKIRAVDMAQALKSIE